MSIDNGGGFDLWEVAKSGWIVAAAVATWVGRSHMSHDSKVHEKAFDRLSDLEKNSVTKDDLQLLDNKLDQVLILLAGRDHR